MPALSLDHWNVFCKDLKKTVDLLREVCRSLRDGDRPPFNFPGAWLYAGEKAILHLVSESGRKDHGGGAIDHVAINCADIRGTIDRIKKDKVPFEVRKVPARPLQQVFLHDPDGVMIELNFWHEADVPEIDNSGKVPGDRLKAETSRRRRQSHGRAPIGAAPPVGASSSIQHLPSVSPSTGRQEILAGQQMVEILPRGHQPLADLERDVGHRADRLAGIGAHHRHGVALVVAARDAFPDIEHLQAGFGHLFSVPCTTSLDASTMLPPPPLERARSC